MKRTARAIAVIASSTLWCLTTSAQPLDKDADAERLFREGQKLMEERRYGEACPKFDAAYHKDHQLGTLLNLAYCHKEQGAIWQAWLEFKEAEGKAIELKRAERRSFARQSMAALEKSLARVVIEVQTKAELTDVLVEDRRVPDAERGHPFAAEPGKRKLTFRAKGKKQVVQLITITKGERPQRITVPDMEDEPIEAPVLPSAPIQSVEQPKVEATPPPVESKNNGSAQKSIALVAFGLGIVGLGVGTAFGLQTLNNECTDGEPTPGRTGGPSCTQEERDAASEKGAISTIAFATSGVAAAAGLVLWFSAPSGKSSATLGGATSGAQRQLRVLPEIGANWLGFRGIF